MIYLHNIANMQNFSVSEPYDLIEHINKITRLGEIVDTNNCVLLNSKTHTVDDPYVFTVPASGTYRVTFLYGAARTNNGTLWGYALQSQWVFGYGAPTIPGGHFILKERHFSGFTYYGGQNYIKGCEDDNRGKYKDFDWVAGDLPFWYADGNNTDNEGSIVYHIKKL